MTLGLLTIPMALLTLASVLAGIWLAASGATHLAGLALLVIVLGLFVAWIMEFLLEHAENFALAAQARWGSAAGDLFALLCGVVPTLIVLMWGYGSFRGVFIADEAASPAAEWLLSYGVATAPWTLFALHARSDRRTVSGIRAYAAHLSYWLLSLAFLTAPGSLTLAAAAMLFPAMLPCTVGTLLARADRDMLRSVRI